MLSNNEWKLLDELIKILIPIESATEFLGGQKYSTLSLIFPTIQTLEYEYTPNLRDEIDNGENDGMFLIIFLINFNVNYMLICFLIITRGFK